MGPESSFQIAPNYLQVGKIAMTSQFFYMTSSSKTFSPRFVCLAAFSYCSRFHVNIVTGSGVKTLSFHKELTRNSEIGNVSVSVLPNIWRLWQIRDTKFGTSLSNKTLLKVEKYHYCS